MSTVHGHPPPRQMVQDGARNLLLVNLDQWQMGPEQDQSKQEAPCRKLQLKAYRFVYGTWTLWQKWLTATALFKVFHVQEFFIVTLAFLAWMLRRQFFFVESLNMGLKIFWAAGALESAKRTVHEMITGYPVRLCFRDTVFFMIFDHMFLQIYVSRKTNFLYIYRSL